MKRRFKITPEGDTYGEDVEEVVEGRRCTVRSRRYMYRRVVM
jgi:hypothetical protein